MYPILVLLAVYAGLLFLAVAYYAFSRFSLKRTLEQAPPGPARDRLRLQLKDPDAVIRAYRYLRVLAIIVAVAAVSSAYGPRLGLPPLATGAAAALFIVLGIEVPAAVFAPRAAPFLLSRAAPLFFAVHWLARPIVALHDFLDHAVHALGGKSGRELEQERAAEELHAAAQEGERGGLLDERGRAMIEAILRLNQTTVGAIMTPWVEVVLLSVDAPIEEALWVARWKRHSRIPVYEGGKDHIIGILQVKDLLEDWGKSAGEVDLRRHLRPVRHVPDSKPAGALLEEFRRSRSPIAIVVDELGRATGLVTLADLLEVIVGEIRDEEDRRAALVQLPGGGADLAGYLPTERVNEELGTRIPESEAYDTIGGFVVTRFGRVPSQGESVREGEFEFTVLDADGRRVHRLRIVPVAAMVRPGPAPAP